jgi:AraC-like DNA-binding protein
MFGKDATGGTRRFGPVRKTAASDRTPAVYTYVPVPGVPPVSVFRFGRDEVLAAAGRHAHDFPAVAYFERDGGALVSAGRRWDARAGDLFVVPPGLVMSGEDLDALAAAGGWGVAFTPYALGADAPGSLLSWHSHPLLSAFVQGDATTALRFNVPREQRSGWTARLRALDRELHGRRPGFREAVLSHLTLLLVEVARLTRDVPGDLRRNDQPLLAEVFEVIEQRYQGPLSLRDVAREVNLTPGYLTTVVRRRTGRTVLEWIAERRIAEARRLLVETDRSVEEIGRAVGYDDTGYFIRVFRRFHAITPLAWRRAARP